jgi:hypothetical protein
MGEEMACVFRCDNCAREAPAERGERGYQKPPSWFQRGDSDGVQDACSRDCAIEINRRSGKHAPIATKAAMGER